MKKIIATLAVYGSLAILAVPGFTQTPSPSPAAQGACSDESKAAMYTDFTTYRTTDATKAYEAAKKYLACSPQEDQYTAYLKKWTTAYDKEARKLKFQPLLYNEKKYQEALTLGKEMLAENPENLRLLIDLGYGSYLAAATLKNESFNADALSYARKAIQQIEAGKAPESWAPFKGKDDTLAYLHNVVGRLTLKDNPSAALGSLIKEAQFDTDLKKDPWAYYFIAVAYETGPYAKLSADYKICCEGKDETPQSKLALENINQVVDRMVDAYARAVALAGTDAKFQANKKDWMDGLSTWYKYRHNQTDTGLTELIASVLSKPLPPEPTPLTSLPAGAPTTTTPASGSVSTPSGSTTGATVPAATNKAASTTTVTTPTVTPKTTTTTGAAAGTPGSGATKPAVPAAKPKTKNNHRRH